MAELRVMLAQWAPLLSAVTELSRKQCDRQIFSASVLLCMALNCLYEVSMNYLPLARLLVQDNKGLSIKMSQFHNECIS